MSFASFLVIVGMFCFAVSIVLGVLTFTSDPTNAAGCFVMAVAGWLLIWIGKVAGEK